MSRRERDIDTDEASPSEDSRTRPKLDGDMPRPDGDESDGVVPMDICSDDPVIDEDIDTGGPVVTDVDDVEEDLDERSAIEEDDSDDNGSSDKGDGAPEAMDTRADARNITNAFATGDTNSTDRRGLENETLLDEVIVGAVDVELALRNIAKDLCEELHLQRDEAIHVMRGLVVGLRGFLELFKIFLRHNDPGRASYFALSTKGRFLLLSRYAYILYDPTKAVNVSKDFEPQELRATFFIAASVAKTKYEEGRKGWDALSGGTSPTLPPFLFKQFYSSTLRTVLANDELVADRQGDKVERILMEGVKREPDFLEQAEAVLIRHPHHCKSYVRFMMQDQLACFPSAAAKAKAAQKAVLDSDEEKVRRYMAEAEAAEAQGRDDAPQDEEELREQGLDEEGRKKKQIDVTLPKPDNKHGIPERVLGQMKPFTTIVDRFVTTLAARVVAQFPVSGPQRVQLPALKSADRRRLLWCLCNWYGPLELQGQRQLGTAFGVRGFVSELVAVLPGKLHIGGEAAAMHAGAAGFSFVVNCAAEVPCYYEDFGVTYLHLRLKHTTDFGEVERATVKEFLRSVPDNAQVLVQCREGRCRSVLVAFFILVSHFGVDANQALRRVYESVPCCGVGLSEFQAVLPPSQSALSNDLRSNVFNHQFEEVLGDMSFARTLGSMKVKCENDVVFDALYLTPLHYRSIGGAHYGFVDYLAAVALKQEAFPLAVSFFAEHLGLALQQQFPRDKIVLVGYPGHDTGSSVTQQLVAEMCQHFGNFVDASEYFVRTRRSPHRSKGGTRDIQEQFGSLFVKPGLLNMLNTLQEEEEEHTIRLMCVDDNVDSGSSLSVFGTMMVRAGVSVPLGAITIGRFMTPTLSFAASPYILVPSSDFTVAPPVSPPMNVSVDVPASVPLQDLANCKHSVRKGPSLDTSTIVFESAEDALRFSSHVFAVPHFVVTDAHCDQVPELQVGFPVEKVVASPSVIKFRRVSARLLYLASHKKGDPRVDWRKLSAEEKSHFSSRSRAPLTRDDVVLKLRDLKLVESPEEEAAISQSCSLDLSSPVASAFAERLVAAVDQLQQQGIRVEKVRPTYSHVTQRIWIDGNLEQDCSDWVDKLQIPAGHIAKLVNGTRVSSLTPKNMKKLEGRPVRVLFQPIRGAVPELKRSASAKWKPSYVALNVAALAWITFTAMRKKVAVPGFPQALLQFLDYARRGGLMDGLNVTQLSDALVAALQRPLLHQAGANAGQYDLTAMSDGTLPYLLAMFHFSCSDLRRACSSTDKVTGLSSPGGRVVHILISRPERAKGFNAATKRAAAFAEGSSVLRHVQQLPEETAKVRATIVCNELFSLLAVTEELRECAAEITLISKSSDRVVQAMLMCDKVYEFLLRLRPFVLQLPSWSCLPNESCYVSWQLYEAFLACETILSQTSATALWYSDERKNERGAGSHMKKLTKAQKRPCTLLSSLQHGIKQFLFAGDLLCAEFLPLSELSAERAVESLLLSPGSLSWGGDGGRDEEQFCGFLERAAHQFYVLAKEHNLADGPTGAAGVKKAVPAFMDQLQITASATFFKVGMGLYSERVRAPFRERERADAQAQANDRLAELSSRDQEPASAASVVASSLRHASQMRGGAVCSPHEFSYGNGSVASVSRICSILLRAPAVQQAYNVKAFAASKARAHVARDELAQMTVNHMERTQLQFSLHPVVRVFEAVCDKPDKVAIVLLNEFLDDETLTAKERKHVKRALKDLPVDFEEQLTYLMTCALRVLSKLNRNMTVQSDEDTMEEIWKLRRRHRSLYAHVPLQYYKPPSSLASLGKWNCIMPHGARSASFWPRAAYQRALQQNLKRRAKQQKSCRDEMLVCLAAGKRVPKAVKGGLFMVTIQIKPISEIRSTKQAPLLSALFSSERLDTVAPSKSNFPKLVTDFPWKLRSFCGNVNGELRRILMQRDVSASFAMAWTSLWERYAYEENLFYELVMQCKKRVLLRPAPYLYHLDYDKWRAGQLKVNTISRF